ncbi:concanavalin A-like lectin/glucanase domain-containing protein [Hyaloraphidium curvatum]|nr:concanavalin A-like lectin/glucanase domain-containing protein [Hyaloraphidium curvatum]
MKRISLLAACAALLSLAGSVRGQQTTCQFFGAPCPSTSPCCNSGYCDTGGLFCGAGCDPSASFPGACYERHPCVTYSETFDDPSMLVQSKDWDGDPDHAHWISQFSPSYAAIRNGELQLWMRKDDKLNEFGRVQGFGATVYNTRWVKYGVITARVQSGKGLGVVTSFITKADPTASITVPDEIDWEFVGRLPTSVYSNWFAANDLDYGQGQIHDLGSETHDNWHTLTIDWKPDYIRWLSDGRVLRTLLKNQTSKFPTEESRISFSIWDGGQGAPGTADWAGSPTDWSRDPNPDYVLHVDSFSVDCLSSATRTTRSSSRTATSTFTSSLRTSTATLSSAPTTRTTELSSATTRTTFATSAATTSAATTPATSSATTQATSSSSPSPVSTTSIRSTITIDLGAAPPGAQARPAVFALAALAVAAALLL